MRWPFGKKKRSKSDQEERLSDITKKVEIKSDQTAITRSRKHYTREEEARLSEMFEEGQTLEAISLEFKRSKREISNKKYKMKIQKRYKSENAKLRETNSDLEAINENLNSDIAKKEERLKNLDSDIARREERIRIVVQKHKKIFENYEESKRFQKNIPGLLGLTKRRYSELNEEKDISDEDEEKDVSVVDEVKKLLEKLQ